MTYQDLQARYLSIVPASSNRPYAVVTTTWQTMNDLDLFASVAPETWPDRLSNRESMTSWSGPSDDWYGGSKSLADSLRLLREGWPEGSKRAKDLAQRIMASLPMKGSRPVQEPRMTVAPINGVCIDPVSFLKGLPTPFISQVDTPVLKARGKAITIGFNPSASCGVSGEVLKARAACISALVQSLIRLGYTCRVICYSPWHNRPENKPGKKQVKPCVTVTAWEVMKFGQHLNLDRLAFACGHPSMTRRIIFMSTEHTPKEFHTSRLCHNYGNPVSVREYLPELVAQCDLFVDSDACFARGTKTMIPMWADAAEQINWVRAQLESQGIVFMSEAR